MKIDLILTIFYYFITADKLFQPYVRHTLQRERHRGIDAGPREKPASRGRKRQKRGAEILPRRRATAF